MPQTRIATLVIPIAAVAGCASTSPDAAEKSLWNCSARVELSSLWGHLAGRYDANMDGVISPAEYGRGDVQFANYDRSGDGQLTESDFPEDTYFNGFSHMLLRDADADEDGEITRTEWASFTSEFDGNEDGKVVRDEVEAVMGSWTDDWPLFLLSFDQDTDGDFDADDLALTFRDQDYNGDGVLADKELSGWQRTIERTDIEPPAAGEPAPDFTLRYADRPEAAFHLLDPARTKPVALIFGSYT